MEKRTRNIPPEEDRRFKVETNPNDLTSAEIIAFFENDVREKEKLVRSWRSMYFGNRKGFVW